MSRSCKDDSHGAGEMIEIPSTAAQRVLEQQAQVEVTRSQQFPVINRGRDGVAATFPNNITGSSSGISSPLAFGNINW